MKRFISVLLAVMLIMTSALSAFAADTLPGASGENTTWDGTDTDRPYRNLAVYDNAISNNTSMGLKPVNVYNIGDMRAVSSAKQAAPSVSEIAASSGDIININAAKVLYNKGLVVDHLNTKQITVSDFEAIMWSFVISQFATPYEDNLTDVLSHSIFQQMINQDLEIRSTPDSSAANVAWVEVFKPGTQVVDTVKFADVANTIKNNLSYKVLYDSSGQSQVKLYNFLTADMGSVFYIKDQEAGFAGVENKEIWDNRRDLLAKYDKDSEIEVREKLIPIYVQSNLTLIQNQLNLGSFLKGQAPLSGTASSGDKEPSFDNVVGDDGGSTPAEAAETKQTTNKSGEPSFNTVIGEGAASGTMGPCPMFVDSFGNICVYHENKMKIVLCNAQNTLFTSRPDNEDETVDVVRVSNGSSTVNQNLGNKYSVDLFTKDKEPSLGDVRIYEDDSDPFSIITNESLAVYNKPLMTVYSRALSSGHWNNKTLHFTGDTVREDYPGFLDFHRELQNAHGNQLILFRPPVFNLSSLDSDTDPYSQDFSSRLLFANNEEPTYRGLPMKDGLLFKGDPSQRFYLLKQGDVQKWFEGWGADRNALNNAAVASSALYLYTDNLHRYYEFVEDKAGQNDKDANGANSPWAKKIQQVSDITPQDLELAYFVAMNRMLFAGMGIDQDKMIEDSFVSADLGADFDTRNYTVGGALAYSFDFGQYWSIVNEANVTDATIDDIVSGVIPQISAVGDAEGAYRSGLLKPFNRIQWTIKEKDYLELQGYIDEYVETHPDVDLSDESSWDDISADGNVKKWIEDHASDVFTDTLYYQLRDTRVSDAWVSYSSEEVALMAYVWLNYYLPKSLFPRYFIDGSYEESKMFNTLIDEWNVGVTSNDTEKSEADKSREEKMQATGYDTAYIDGSNSVKWGSSQVILGPYVEIHGVTQEDMEYEFYPDTSPFPAVVKMLTVEEDGTYTQTITNHITVNTYDLIMALYRNTNTSANDIKIETRGPDLPIVDKQEILYGLNMFLKYPGTTIISWLVSLLQGIHRSMANGRFGDFFNVGWIADTAIWATVFQYYCIIVLSCVAVASIYLFINLLLNRKVGLWMTIRRVGTSVVITLIPVLLINTMVYGLDAMTKGQLQSVMDKAATAESAALITGMANANEDFEFNYQLFREQFDSIEDVLGKYGYQLPVSYYKSIDRFKYSNESWSNTMNSTSWKSNQTLQKWYDYRAFVPVHRDKYSQNLYYYFYDYIKWQFLNYAANTDNTGTSLRIRDRAREYTFGAAPSATTFDAIQEECLKPGSDSPVITSKEMADFINNLDELMLQAKGDFAVMMQDPNYIYGESFDKTKNEAWGSYYLEDMFGFGYLLTDVYPGAVSPDGEALQAPADAKWEVSDELYKYPGWIRYREHPALSKAVFNDGTNQSAYKNQGAFVKYLDDTQRRGGRVYGSYSSLYSSVDYNKKLAKVKLTELEKALIEVNERTYDRVRDFIRYFPADTPNEAYISLAALSATFEFNKEFGNYGLLAITNPLEPTGYKSDTITLDSTLKGIFARDINDILQSRELFYMIVDNAGGFGIAPCIILVLADVAAFMSLITRNVLITLIFGASVFCVIFNYMLRQRQRNRTLLGIGTQCAGVVIMHLIMSYGMSLVTYFSIGAPSLWTDVIFSLILMLLFAVCAVVHIFMLRLVMKDFTNFGGNIVAQKLDNLRTKFTGMFKGRAHFGDVSLRKMLKEQEQNEKDPYNYNVAENLQRLDSKASAIGGLNALEEYYTDGKGDFSDKLRMGRYAEAVIMRRGSKTMDSCRATRTNERSAPNILRNSEHGSEVARGFEMGSDTRFSSGAQVTNPESLHAAARASTAVREAKAEKIERKSKKEQIKERTKSQARVSSRASLSDIRPAASRDNSTSRATVTAVADRRMKEAKSAIKRDQESIGKKTASGRTIYRNTGGQTTVRSGRDSERKKAIVAARTQNLSPEMKRRTKEIREQKRKVG